jgi:hypothetical protein
VSGESQIYQAKQSSAIAKIIPVRPRLSDEMLNQINQLLPWSSDSPDSQQQYYDFFSSFGTHVVLRVALGGLLRIVSKVDTSTIKYASSKSMGFEAGVSALDPAGGEIKASAQHQASHGRSLSTEKRRVNIFRDGGGAVASQLTWVLEEQFSRPHSGSPSTMLSGWTDVRMQWIDALHHDPVFFPDHPMTEYLWLYQLDGLTDKQQHDLRLASQSYLQVRPTEKCPETPPVFRSSTQPDLPRKQNHTGVMRLLNTAINFFNRVKGQRQKES